MATGKDHLESIVGGRATKHRNTGTLRLDPLKTCQQLLFAGIGLLTSNPINGPPSGNGGDPASGVGRHTGLGPGSQNIGERILNPLRGKINVP